FGFATSAIDRIVKRLGRDVRKAGHHETRRATLRTGLGTADDVSRVRPVLSLIRSALKTADSQWTLPRLHVEGITDARLLEEMAEGALQRRIGSVADDVIHTLRFEPIEDFGFAVMAVSAQHEFDLWPARAEASSDSPQERNDLPCRGRF